MHDSDSSADFDPQRITQPDPSLLTYYALVSALTVVGFPIVFLPLFCKYHTLRYRFDDKGVSMSWGVLFKREIYLTYRRIQDIHVSRNLFHRWLGLAAISVQTASGSSGAEMIIEGIPQVEPLRDYLYAQMRGAKDDSQTEPQTEPAAGSQDEALQLLREIRDSLRQLHRRRGETQ